MTEDIQPDTAELDDTEPADGETVVDGRFVRVEERGPSGGALPRRPQQ